MATPRSASGYDLTPIDAARRRDLARNLSAEQRHILLEHGTEPPFCGALPTEKHTGTYVCALCGLPLFHSEQKFASGSGWPSFFAPFDPAHIREVRDTSHGMSRTEICCVRCDGHLGHVFPDGPPPSGLRYCLNSAALRFVAGGVPPDLPGGPA
jgi:peptide-methionine (R)-S-oxide reductase